MTKAHILLVDDDPGVLDNLSSLLGAAYRVSVAASAAEARHIMQREPIHVLISDYRMPEEDGLCLLVESKRRKPDVVRVLLTAYGDTDLVVRAINEGEIHRFISKPYRSGDLLRTVEECVRISPFAPGPRSAGPSGRTVLVAHDSRQFLSAVEAALPPRYDLLKTGSGFEALSLISGGGIDALVTGTGLEMIDGYTLLSYLKKEKRVAFPVVVSTRNVTPKLEEHLLGRGADLVIDEGGEEAARRLLGFLDERLA